MSERLFFALVALALVLVFYGASLMIDADKPHMKCVEARRIEVIVGKPARHCPALQTWREPNGHEAIDHE